MNSRAPRGQTRPARDAEHTVRTDCHSHSTSEICVALCPVSTLSTPGSSPLSTIPSPKGRSTQSGEQEIVDFEWTALTCIRFGSKGSEMNEAGRPPTTEEIPATWGLVFHELYLAFANLIGATINISIYLTRRMRSASRHLYARFASALGLL